MAEAENGNNNNHYFVGKLNDYLAAFARHDLAAIRGMLSEGVIVELDGNILAQGRDTILPSYEKDFAAGKVVRTTTDPRLVEDGVVEVGLEAIEINNKRTLLTVRYHYDSNGLQVRHSLYDVRVTEGAATSTTK